MGPGEEAHSPGVAHVVTLVVRVFAIDRPFATFPPCPVQKRNNKLVRIKCILSTWLSLFESDFCQYWQECRWYIDNNYKSCRWKPGNPAEILKHELVLKTTLIVIMTPHQTHIRCRGHPINGTAIPQACDDTVMWRPRVFKMRLVIFLLAHVSSPKSWWSCTPTSKKKNCKTIINSVSKFQKASWLAKWHHLCKFVNILAWKTNQIGNMKTAKP